MNGFTEGNDDDAIALLQITNEDEARQLKRLDASATTARPGRRRCRARHACATEAADPELNLMPTLIEAVSTYATLGEIMGALADVFGRYVEVPTL